MKYNNLKIIALSIWWGAFTFYAGIVVPVGMRVLGSHTEMGFITQQVVNFNQTVINCPSFSRRHVNVVVC